MCECVHHAEREEVRWRYWEDFIFCVYRRLLADDAKFVGEMCFEEVVTHWGIPYALGGCDYSAYFYADRCEGNAR